MADDIQKRLRQMNERASTRRLTDKAAEMLSSRDIAPLSAIPWVLQLRVVSTPHVLNLIIADTPTVLGRRVGGTKAQPDFDLMPYGAFDMGVSRRHAMLAATNEFLTLTDLDSSNGTFLNSMRLTPNQPFPLQNGDVITLGELHLQLQFNVMPSQDLTPRRNGQGRHLLIIEDDMDVAIAYRAVFERFGYRVSVTDEPAEVLLFLSQVTPDLVICDLILDNIPNQKQVDVVHMLHRELPPRVPILVVSGVTAGHQRQEALASGAADFIGKPVRTGILLAKVDELINRPRATSV